MSIKSLRPITQVKADLVPSPGYTAPDSYTTKKDSRREGLTDLSIIGVPDSCQNRNPTVTAFPKKFNKDSQKVWIALIQDKEYQAKVRVWGDLDLIWHNTLQDFLSLCEDAGVFPFSNNLDTSSNQYVIDFVRRARIALVQYANEAGIFERVKIRKAYREYVRKENGLTLTSWADIYPLKDDNLDFEKWIQTSPFPRMLKHVDNKYVKMVQPHVRMWVRYINKSRVRIGFDIDVIGQISVPKKNLANRKQVDAYIDRFVYLPVIRSHRFKHVRTRLF
jgi:hypothetical protein